MSGGVSRYHSHTPVLSPTLLPPLPLPPLSLLRLRVVLSPPSAPLCLLSISLIWWLLLAAEAIAATIATVAATLLLAGGGRSVYSLKSSSARTECKMEAKGCLQSGHSALLCDHSWMQGKQKRCRQRSRYARLLKRSRQIGHLESGDASSAAITARAEAAAEEEEGGDEEEAAAAAVGVLLVFFLLLLRLPLSRLLSSSSSG